MTKSYEINFTKGGYFLPLLSFAVPLMLSNLLQLFYNAADIIVVGQFIGDGALAAVGSATPLIDFFTNLFLGLSIGSNVLIADSFGLGDKAKISKAVHTSISVGIITGFLLGTAGFILSEKILLIMHTPADVIESANIYLKIYFVGLPALSLYNFAGSVLRAIGDTKRPLYFLIISGFVNVALNVFFVAVLGMGVDGVAYATVISEILSAVLAIFCLIHSKETYRLEIKKLAIYKNELLRILKVGIPAGIQGALFSLSNILIQSNINSFGSSVMAANSASGNIEGFVHMAMNSIQYSAITFSAQNLSINNTDRIQKGFRCCLALVVMIWLIVGGAVLIFMNPLLGLFSKDSTVISYASSRLIIILCTYFLCGFMESISGTLRGLSYSVLPMIISLIGACGFRIAWIYALFAIFGRSLRILYLAYPFSWAITAFSLYIAYKIIMRKKEYITAR